MELHVWETLLLQWVQKCNFIESTSCLEDSKIEAFFAIYMQYAHIELPANQSGTSLTTKYPLTSLQIFLREIYPNFKLNLEHDGRVAPADYIYVYTLLMHYTCVQKPSEYFQNICKHFPDNMQQSIAIFLKETVNMPQLTRNSLREAIINIQNNTKKNVPVSVPSLVLENTPSGFSQQNCCRSRDLPNPLSNNISNRINPLLCDNHINITNSTLVDNELNASVNHVTPMEQKVDQKPAPPTPKTELLEQRTRELLELRAQLETERYEKTVLEEQILENEQLINSLSKENKVKKKQLAMLSATLQDENVNEESCKNNYVHNEFDNINRRLRIDLRNKDAVLAENTEQMHDLKTKYAKVAYKLKESEKQMLVCMDRINDLELRLENVTQLLAEKEEDIVCLQRDKFELQQCLQETRDELHNGREILNASSDLLDTSQSVCNIIAVPENLGCSVIDKQLREQEQENDQLRRELAAIADAKTLVRGELLKLVQHFKLEVREGTDDMQLLHLLGRSINQLFVSYKQEQHCVKKLQDQYNTLQQQSTQDQEHMQQLENEAQVLNQNLQQSKFALLDINKKLQKQDKDIRQFDNIFQELEKKDQKLAQTGCELMQLCSQYRILEENNKRKNFCILDEFQKLEEQKMLILSQEKQLTSQRKQLSNEHHQLQSFFNIISAQFDKQTISSPKGISRLEEVENILMRRLEEMSNKLEESRAKLSETSKHLTVQDMLANEMLNSLNTYIPQPIDHVNTNGLPKKLELLRIQLAQFLCNYEELNDKCIVLENNRVKDDKVKQEHDMLQRRYQEYCLEQTNKTEQLQMQCEQIMYQLQQKITECEEVTQELQISKSRRTKVQHDLSEELQKKDKQYINQLNEYRNDSRQHMELAAHKLHEQELKVGHLDLERMTSDKTQNQFELKLTENANERKKDRFQLFQQLEDGRQELCKQTLKQSQIKMELTAGKEKHRLLDQELLEKVELASQSMHEQVKVLAQQLEDRQRELNETQQKLKVATQQIQKMNQQLCDKESLQMHADKLMILLTEEQRKNLGLEEKHLKEIEHNRIIEKELRAMQDLFAKKKKSEKSESQIDLNTKRFEKTSMLCEHQAILTKSQSEIAQAELQQKVQAELIIALQHEKESLQMELQKNKELVNRAQEKRASLEQERDLMDAARSTIHERMITLEREHGNVGKTVHELQKKVKVIEQEKMSLILEVDGLNSEIVKNQQLMADLKVELQQANETIIAMRKSSLTEDNKDCNAQNLEHLYMQRLGIVEAQLAEALQELHGTRLINESVQYELDDKINQLKSERKKSSESESYYELKLQTLKDELEKCNADIGDIRNSHDKLLDKLHKENQNSGHLHDTQEQLNQQRGKTHQLEHDCQILQAKYREAKEQIGRCEQKLKDQRIEMEGKLEKMKTKMRTLYTAEVTRIREKQERDESSNKIELEKLSVENSNYKEHTRTLSNQIVCLNEKILEQQKHLAILNTKLQHLHEGNKATTASSAADDWHSFKQPIAPSTNLGTNLAMEDEEGEVFNNTYLTDLKLGVVPDMTAEELQYRNSLQPPHLKSAYAAQYDFGTQEDDLKVGQHSLDDSMSALLSTTGSNSAGTRKRPMGTHYKRPGPPTPSKNGGRMSFGNSDPPREILREASDNNGALKTPARFKIFASRFSSTSGIGGGLHCLSRDEQRRQRKQKLLTGMHRRHMQLQASAAFCTSTPRKSRSYYDQQRLIMQCDAVPEGQGEQYRQKGTPHLSHAALLAMTNADGRKLNICRRRSETATSSSSSSASIGHIVSSKHKRKANARISFCLHGNIFAKGRSRVKIPSTAQISYQRLKQKNKTKEHRFGCFDQGRHLCNDDFETEQNETKETQDSNATFAVGNPNDNNNYYAHSRNKTFDRKNSALDQIQAGTYYVKPASNNASYPFLAAEHKPAFLKAQAAAVDCSRNANLVVHQQFKKEYVCTWLNGAASTTKKDLSYDFNFKQLCPQTASTASFVLQAPQYRPRLCETEEHKEGQSLNSPPKRRISNMFKRK